MIPVGSWALPHNMTGRITPCIFGVLGDLEANRIGTYLELWPLAARNERLRFWQEPISKGKGGITWGASRSPPDGRIVVLLEPPELLASPIAREIFPASGRTGGKDGRKV